MCMCLCAHVCIYACIDGWLFTALVVCCCVFVYVCGGKVCIRKCMYVCMHVWVIVPLRIGLRVYAMMHAYVGMRVCIHESQPARLY